MSAEVVGIMQPYYFPYLGYFSHIFASDLFVIHDDVKYTKKGWINRNRILTGSKTSMISLPLSRSSDSSLIKEKWIAPEYQSEKQGRVIEGAYRKAPFWDELRGNLDNLLGIEERNLAKHLTTLIEHLCNLLEIKTRIVCSSDLLISPSLAGQDRVIAICKTLGARTYLNPEGGKALYDLQRFRREGLNLAFLSHIPEIYPQHAIQQSENVHSRFAERLSVLDPLAQVGAEKTREKVQQDFAIHPAIKSL